MTITHDADGWHFTPHGAAAREFLDQEFAMIGDRDATTAECLAITARAFDAGFRVIQVEG